MNNKFHTESIKSDSDPFGIESGFPIPNNKRGPEPKHPFERMQIGNSITGPRSMTLSAYTYGFRHNKKFIARKISENQYRVWRVK